MNREEALKLLEEYVQSESLIKHSLAVEAVMREYAKIFGEDTELWGLCGLLHDIGYEKYPEKHPIEDAEILKANGFNLEFANAVAGHANSSGIERKTNMAKALYAADQLAGFVVAVALVRPEKFEGLKLKSVKKKLKDKKFAEAVSREGIKAGAIELNIELDEHIQNTINALVKRNDELKSLNQSLI